ncbi:MAG: hypothetical protein GY807_18530 [Gammaproteobacteria bacterium]|nr:hypothetical protein [Gammaproteobacteria bacterium]
MNQRISTNVQLRKELYRKESAKVRNTVRHKKGLFIPKNMLVRSVLAMLLMAAYLGAYTAYGVVGLVTLALLVLLGLCHPFWLTNWARREKKISKSRSKDMGRESSNPANEVQARYF